MAVSGHGPRQPMEFIEQTGFVERNGVMLTAAKVG
jgi:hypothetical protein